MKVYLSSTLNDLGPERQAVKDALQGECSIVEPELQGRGTQDHCRQPVVDKILTHLGLDP